jgi:hypothetical protein
VRAQALHSAAYQGGLGRPLVAPREVLGNLGADAASYFYAQNFTAPRIVLAAGAQPLWVGVGGDEGGGAD